MSCIACQKERLSAWLSGDLPFLAFLILAYEATSFDILLNLGIPPIGHEVLKPFSEPSELLTRKPRNCRFKILNAHTFIKWYRHAECKLMVVPRWKTGRGPSRIIGQRLRALPLPAVHAPITSGWSSSCRVGYLPPTGTARSFHGALGITADSAFASSRRAIDLICCRWSRPVG